jgi:hypothetical protein
MQRNKLSSSRLVLSILTKLLKVKDRALHWSLTSREIRLSRRRKLVEAIFAEVFIALFVMHMYRHITEAERARIHHQVLLCPKRAKMMF